MKTEQEIRSMRDEASSCINENTENDDPEFIIYEALNWVLGEHEDDVIRDYLPL